MREALLRYHERVYGLELDPGRLAVPGSSMLGITIAAQMTVGRGDHAIVVTPHWPNIDRTLSVIGARFDYIRQTQNASGWGLSLDKIRNALRPDTRALYINSPCNPTGWIMRPDQQAELLEICRERGIVIIADEVYHRTVYEADVAPSFLQIARPDDPLIVVNGFSKAYAMTGWRLGWMVVPEGYTEQMMVLSECFATSAPSFIQRAGVTALDEGESLIRQLRDQYAESRACVMRLLAPHARVELAEPEGAFYAFPRITGIESSEAFVNRLLDTEDVGLAPGFTFGPDNEQHVRLCFAQSPARLEQALIRMLRFLDTEP